MHRPFLKLQSARAGFGTDERGATAIEYGLIAAGIAIAIVIVVFAVGNSLENLFDEIEVAVGVCDDKSKASEMGLKMGKGHGCK